MVNLRTGDERKILKEKKNGSTSEDKLFQTNETTSSVFFAVQKKFIIFYDQNFSWLETNDCELIVCANVINHLNCDNMYSVPRSFITFRVHIWRNIFSCLI